jgi:hypothetical protein
MAVSCHTHSLAALPTGKEPLGMHSLGGRVDTQTGLDDLQKRKIICCCWESNDDSSGGQPVAY